MNEFDALRSRVAALERAQRGGWLAAAAITVIAVATVAINAQSGGSQVLTARELNLVGANGKIAAKITPQAGLGSYTGIAILSATNQQLLSIVGGDRETILAINSPGDVFSKDFGGFSVHATPGLSQATVSSGRSEVVISAIPDVADVAVAGVATSHIRVATIPKGTPVPPNATTPEELAKIFTPKTNMDTKTAVDLLAGADDAQVSVADTRGFEAEIGNVGLQTERTGNTTRTSAASVLLFGADKKVLWRAP